MGQFADDLFEQLGIEHPGGLSERASAKTRDIERPLNFFEFGRRLNHPKRIADRVEKIQQDQRDILIVMQPAFVGMVGIDVNRVQGFGELSRILKCLNPPRSLSFMFLCLPRAMPL
jgi:hypothetical protein